MKSSERRVCHNNLLWFTFIWNLVFLLVIICHLLGFELIFVCFGGMFLFDAFLWQFFGEIPFLWLVCSVEMVAPLVVALIISLSTWHKLVLTWEEGTSSEELPLSNWYVCVALFWLIFDVVGSRAHHVGDGTPGLVVLGCIGEQAEQARKQHYSTVSASVIASRLLPWVPVMASLSDGL